MILQHNNIKTIEKYPNNIEKIELAHNPIETDIINLNYVYFIDIAYTKIKHVDNLPNLTFIDASYSNILSILNTPNVETLICDNSPNLHLLDNNMNNLNELSIVNTNICYINFYPKLETLFITNNKIQFNKHFKVHNITLNSQNIIKIILKN
jgi:hypothetical protein